MMKPINTWTDFLKDRRDPDLSFIMADAELLCTECANFETDCIQARDTFEDGDNEEWLVIGSTADSKGTCCHCGKEIK